MIKKSLFLTLLFLTSLVGFGQLDVKKNYRKPYFQGSVEVKDTLRIDNFLELKDDALIKSENGSSSLNLRFSGTDGKIGLLGNFFEATMGTFFVDDAIGSVVANTGAASLALFKGNFTKLGQISIGYNDGTDIFSSNLPSYPTILSSQNSTVKDGVINSNILGGLGVISKTDNTAYANQIGFNTGLAGEMILSHTPNAGNFTATLKAESGTIAYLSDVSSIYSLDGTLSSNRVMTMAGNSLSFTGGNVLFETGDVVVGSSSGDVSAILDVVSTSKGFLMPRLTNAQMNAIASPSEGLEVYNTTNKRVNIYDGSDWKQIALIEDIAASKGHFIKNIISPGTLSSDVDNWSPTGYDDETDLIRINITSNRDISGIVAPSPGVNRVLGVTNLNNSNDDIKFEHNDSGSLAANRFLLRDAADKTIKPNETAWFWYDHLSSRWRPFNRVG
jgi:hypothetical protein